MKDKLDCRCINVCILVFFIFPLSIFSIDSKKNDTFDIIINRIQEDVITQSDIQAISKKISSIITIYDVEKGVFKDINYEKFYREKNLPIKHLERLYDMALVYVCNSDDNPYYKDKDILKKIESGLEFWHTKNFTCWNWWYNEVKEPQLMALTLILLRKGEKILNSELEYKLLYRIKTKGGSPNKYTGANKSDIALHWLYRACLIKDENLLTTAISQGYATVRLAPFKEGLQPDYSFFQHNTQFYVGGYGEEFLKGILMIAYYTHGTKFSIESAKLKLISDFALSSYFNLIRGQYFFMNVIGRSMSRKDASLANKSLRYIEYLKDIDPQNNKEYDIIQNRLMGNTPTSEGVKSNNITYFIGDYVAHIRPSYSIGIRTVSSRTMRSEHGNKENPKTYFLSDGSMHITQEGDEYYNIFPIWDWSRIPGVTNPYYEFSDIPKTVSGITRGTQQFVGGASDSIYSVNSYHLEDHYAAINTSAYKSWFFFDKEIICLGTGISSSSEHPINTTIDQSWLKGDVIAYTFDNKSITLNEGLHSFYNDLKCILHNNRCFLFPYKGNLRVKNVAQKGSWRNINTTQSNKEISKAVFSIWFDHGLKPIGDKYAYIIIPNVNSIDEILNKNQNNIRILANNDSIQAVYHIKLNILEVVSHKAATLKYDKTVLKLDSPAAAIIKGIGTKVVTVHIADPTQSEVITNLDISFIGSGSVIKKRICADFRNTGCFAGKTKMYIINN